MPQRATLALALLTLLGAQGAGHAASGPTDNMIYVPVDQCRLVDTRRSTAGNLVANVPQSFDAYGDAATIAAQGGTSTGCPHPKPGGPAPTAAMLNVFAVGKSAASAGIIRAYAVDSTATRTYSLLPFEPGIHSANGAIIPLCRGTCSGNKHFTLFSDAAAVPVAVDVIGYFYPKDSNVVTVARDGGDFLNPLDAMDYLRGLVTASDPNAPSRVNPWVIQISPGAYNLPSTLTLDVPYVTVRGAGPDITNLVGSSGVAQVKITRGMRNSAPALESLSVISIPDVATPTTPAGDAIWIDLDETLGLSEVIVLKEVVALADDVNPLAVSITGGSVKWSGGGIIGGASAALQLSPIGGASTIVELDNVPVEVVSPQATALSVQSAQLTLRNSTVESRDGAALRTADVNSFEAVVNVVNSTLIGDATGAAYAIFDVSSPGFASILKVSQSVLSGPVQYGNASLSVATSQVDRAPTTGGTGTIACVASYNSSFAPLDPTCN